MGDEGQQMKLLRVRIVAASINKQDFLFLCVFSTPIYRGTEHGDRF